MRTLCGHFSRDLAGSGGVSRDLSPQNCSNHRNSKAAPEKGHAPTLHPFRTTPLFDPFASRYAERVPAYRDASGPDNGEVSTSCDQGACPRFARRNWCQKRRNVDGLGGGSVSPFPMIGASVVTPAPNQRMEPVLTGVEAPVLGLSSMMAPPVLVSTKP